ncbi:uncharacterized protein V1516DRAFT_695778 [Lipomyces oligophaga]|uniref:uncharacterized protein n=1 Tax=Lipomyces oligophaga TaxID=45792 RepID=UPI0034CEBCAF
MSASTDGPIYHSPFKPQRDYNHSDDAEYKRLRGLAENEYKAKSRCLKDSQDAYHSGDGAGAKEFSNRAKEHDRLMDQYNAQAAAFVFRANNADSDADEIDLHGLFVNEAVEYLKERINSSMQRNEDHLEVIVGKGHHSTGGVPKIKPAVINLCEEHGFQYGVEDDNTGVILINFKASGGAIPMSDMPIQPKRRFTKADNHNNQATNNYGNGNYNGPSYANAAQQHPNVGHPQQQFQTENQNTTQNDDLIKIMVGCLKQCCIVM